ncbi:MAG: hypothetical protein ACRD2A_16445, partial [Vicinamibacterales bacterium]
MLLAEISNSPAEFEGETRLLVSSTCFGIAHKAALDAFPISWHAPSLLGRMTFGDAFLHRSLCSLDLASFALSLLRENCQQDD